MTNEKDPAPPTVLGDVERGSDDPPLPPTAAASVPSFVHGVADPDAPRPPGVGPIPDEAEAGPVTASTERRPPFDRSIRPGLVGLAAAIVAVLVAERLGTPILVLVCWIVAVLAALTAAIAGNRARYRITNHPDRRRGLTLALIAQLGGFVVLVGLVAGVFLAVRTAPLDDAPVLGGSNGIERLRWGYQRVRLVQRNGWHPVARDSGSCWTADPDGTEAEKRDVLDRVEESLRRTSCGTRHSHEVLGVYAVDPRADAPYDAARIRDEVLRRCRADWDASIPAGATYALEWPTAPSWDRGDHDVACLLVAEASDSIRSN